MFVVYLCLFIKNCGGDGYLEFSYECLEFIVMGGCGIRLFLEVKERNFLYMCWIVWKGV